MILLVLGIASTGQAQIQSIALPGSATGLRLSRKADPHPSQSLGYLNQAPALKGSPEELAHRVINVKGSNKHADLDSYLKASLNSRRGHALEALVAARLNEYGDGVRSGAKVQLTALLRGNARTRSGASDPADIVQKPRRGKPIRYQLKAGHKAALDACSDPKYKGMYIVTTEEARKKIFDARAKKEARLRSSLEGIPAGPEWTRLNDKLEAHKRETRRLRQRIPKALPPGVKNGAPLPKERECLEMAKKVITEKWNQLFPDGRNRSAVTSAAVVGSSASPNPRRLGRKSAASRRSARSSRALLWLKRTGGDLVARKGLVAGRTSSPILHKVAQSPWFKTSLERLRPLGRLAAKTLGPAFAIYEPYALAQEMLDTADTGNASTAYYALKTGAAVSTSGSALNVAGLLLGAPVPGARVAAALLVLGVGMEIAASRVTDSVREEREALYSELEDESRFRLCLRELQDRADALQDLSTSPAGGAR